LKTPYIIGITGPTGSGKTFVINSLKKTFSDKILVISQDQYYKDKSKLKLERFGRINYDRPEAFENKELVKDILELSKGKSVALSQYDFVSHTRKEGKVKISPAPIIIVEGILIFNDKNLRNLFNLKVFLESDADIRLCRRLIRDIEERGYKIGDLKDTIEFYLSSVKPMQEKYVFQAKKYADLILDTNEGGRKAAVVLRKKILGILK